MVMTSHEIETPPMQTATPVSTGSNRQELHHTTARMLNKDAGNSRQKAFALLIGSIFRLNQFLHWLMAVHKIMRAASEIGHGGFVHVNSHVVVEGREDFLEMDRPVVGVAAQTIG